MTDRIRWGRVLLGGLFSELAIFAVFLPLQSVNPQASVYAVPFLVTAAACLFGWWVGRPLQQRFVVHGVLVAVAASLMWIALVLAAGTWSEIPWLYHVSHALRLAGGAAGGALAARQAASRTAAGAHVA